MASASPVVLNTLFDLSSAALEVAVENMVKANMALKEAEQKGEMLREYREDYVQKLTKQLEKGLGKETHSNYQNFLQNLEQAVSGQKDMIVSIKYQSDAVREVWQAAQRKKMSYEVLLNRAEKKAYVVEQKRDQKMMDEYAMRAKHIHAK